MLEKLIEDYKKACKAINDFFPGWEGIDSECQTIFLLDAKWARRETDNECWGQLGYADPPDNEIWWGERDLDMDQSYENGDFIVFYVVRDKGEYYVFRKSNEITEDKEKH